MPLFFLEAGAAERDALVDENVVADFRGLAHHDAHPVVDEQATADFSAGMDFDSGNEPQTHSRGGRAAYSCAPRANVRRGRARSACRPG